MTQHNLSYWEEMAERYFLAETTDEEEQRLRKFLCTKEAQNDARFDEIRATLSYLHVMKVQHKPSVKHPLRVIAVAACLSAVAFLGWYHYQQQNISSVRIAGQNVEADASQLMERQLTEMFSTTNP